MSMVDLAEKAAAMGKKGKQMVGAIHLPESLKRLIAQSPELLNHPKVKAIIEAAKAHSGALAAGGAGAAGVGAGYAMGHQGADDDDGDEDPMEALKAKAKAAASKFGY